MKLIDFLLTNKLALDITWVKSLIFNRRIYINGVPCNSIFHKLNHNDLVRVGKLEIIFVSQNHQKAG